jgi:hypothetical protein
MASTFACSWNQVVNEALGICGAYDPTNPPQTADYNSVAFTLQCMIKQWMIEGMPMWKVQTNVIQLAQGQTQYQMGPYASGTNALVTDHVARVTYAYVQTNQGGLPFNTPIDQLSIQEYNQYGSPDSQGTVNSMQYFPLKDTADGLSNSYVNVYPTPADGLWTLNMICQIQLNDASSLLTDTPDFPQECYLGLCWSLADLISMKYASSMDRVQWIAQRAKMMYQQLIDWSQENTDSIRLMYDTRGGRY